MAKKKAKKTKQQAAKQRALARDATRFERYLKRRYVPLVARVFGKEQAAIYVNNRRWTRTPPQIWRLLLSIVYPP